MITTSSLGVREGEREFDFEKAEDEHRPPNPPQDNGVPDINDDDDDDDYDDDDDDNGDDDGIHPK